MRLVELVMLCITFIILNLLSITLLRKKNKNIIYKMFIALLYAFAIYVLGLALQIIFYKTDISPVKFEYLSFLGMTTAPVFAFLVGLAYYKEDIIKLKRVIPLFIIPVITTLLFWIDDSLIFENYSVNLNEMRYGTWFYIYTAYTYLLYGSAIVLLIISAIRKSGFYSIQMLFISIGAFVPISVNAILLLGVFEGSVYITPILFSFMVICSYIAIIKLNAFNIIPVASKTVMDTMSDGYVVISNDGTIADSNRTFRRKFDEVLDFENTDKNLFEMFDEVKLIDLKELKTHMNEARKKGDVVTKEYHLENDKINRYFEIDVHPISSKGNAKEYIATLLVFKDVTQHELDMEELKEKQDIIVKQGQLASIGELAGGVAHDINTPISAIKTGILMLNSMNSNKTDEEKEILNRIDNCATKIINIVNSMRNQIRNIGGDTSVVFKISDVVKDIKTISYHEIIKNKSEVVIDIQDDLSICGDPTKLGQVLTNLVVNAAQAYGGKKGGKIEISVLKAPNNNAMIKLVDFAGGIDDTIAPFVFKNILTTKGTSGTGLGLYLAYSIIKGEFNGDITFDTVKGEGTTFYIVIPIA